MALVRGGDGWEAFEIERERDCAVGRSPFVCLCIGVAAGARGPLLPLLEWTPRWPWCEVGRVWRGISRRVLFLFSPLCPFTVAVVGDKAFAILAGWGVVTNS